jgi:DNA-binding NarL/FixJ family response regulator
MTSDVLDHLIKSDDRVTIPVMTRGLPLRIIIVDDHEVVREGLRRTLSEMDALEVVAVAGSGADAISRAARLRPDVVLLDYRLPDLEGDVVCRQLMAVSPRTLVVMVSSYVSADRIRSAVTKESGLDAVRNALAQAHEVRTGTGADGPTPAGQFLLRVLQDDLRERNRLRLTPHQQRVLELAIEGNTDREIGEALCVSESTVRYHLQRIKGRLGARSKVELVRRAFAAGLMD